MRWIINILLLGCLCLSAACGASIEPETAALPVVTPFQAQTPSSGSKAVLTPISPQEYLAKFLPQCEGFALLDQPITFDWPNIRRRTKDLADGLWAYFSCQNAPAAVTAFYQKNLVEPPYNLVEINWVERQQGFLGLYYDSPTLAWFYIWVVPQAQDKQNSYVIVVKSDTDLFHPGECRRDAPEKMMAICFEAGRVLSLEGPRSLQ